MAWPFSRNQKAAPDRQPADVPQRPQTFYLNTGVGVSVIQWNNDIAARHAMQHPIVSRALNKIAESAQQMKWFAEVDPDASKAEQANKTTAINDLNDFLRSPNPDMTPQQLRYWMALNYAAYGRVPFKVGFSATKADRPNGVYPLETAHVKSFSNSRGQVERYEYGNGENAQKFPAKMAWERGGDAKRSAGFVAEIWKPGLKGVQDRLDNNTPLNSVGLPAKVITALLLRAIQTAEGHPNVRYLVTCEKMLTEPQLDALRDVLNEDHGIDGSEAGKIPILQNAGKIEIHTLSNDLSDIHSKMPSDDMARIIFGAFGIPIALAGMGAADGAKFAGNYVESRLAFWQDTIIPGYIEPICQGMTRILCPAGVRIVGDPDSVPALITGRILSMKELKDVDFLTPNEKREMLGWGKIDTTEANTLPAKTNTAAPVGAPTAPE